MVRGLAAGAVSSVLSASSGALEVRQHDDEGDDQRDQQRADGAADFAANGLPARRAVDGGDIAHLRATFISSAVCVESPSM